MKSCIIPRFASLLCALLILLSMTCSSAGAQGQLEKLRGAYTVIAPTQATIWTAKEMGFYAKNGRTSTWCCSSALLSRSRPWCREKRALFMPAHRPSSPATSRVPAPCWWLAAPAKPSDFTDISFLKELESSGFIDTLYK